MCHAVMRCAGDRTNAIGSENTGCLSPNENGMAVAWPRQDVPSDRDEGPRPSSGAPSTSCASAKRSIWCSPTHNAALSRLRCEGNRGASRTEVRQEACDEWRTLARASQVQHEREAVAVVRQGLVEVGRIGLDVKLSLVVVKFQEAQKSAATPVVVCPLVEPLVVRQDLLDP